MKRLILVIALVLSVCATSYAQYAYPSENSLVGSELKVRKGKVYADEVCLSDQQLMTYFSSVQGTDVWSQYQKYAHDYQVGNALSLGGSAAMLAGLCGEFAGIMMVFGGNEQVRKAGSAVAIGSGVLLIGGAGTDIAGGIIKVRANSKIKSLTLGAQQSGLGVALTF